MHISQQKFDIILYSMKGNNETICTAHAQEHSREECVFVEVEQNEFVIHVSASGGSKR